jgi:hypothetical protein
MGMHSVPVSEAPDDYPGLVTVRVRNVFGTDTVYPDNPAAISFARIAGTKTIEQDTMRHIRDLGFVVKCLTGDLPRGF